VTNGSDCVTGKTQYASKAVAKQASASHVHGRGLNTFRCPFCGCWHVGNRRQSVSKQRQRR
jgi:hypothetical protein